MLVALKVLAHHLDAHIIMIGGAGIGNVRVLIFIQCLCQLADGNLLQRLEGAVAHTAVDGILVVTVGENGRSLPTEPDAAVLAFGGERYVVVERGFHLNRCLQVIRTLAGRHLAPTVGQEVYLVGVFIVEL